MKKLALALAGAALLAVAGAALYADAARKAAGGPTLTGCLNSGGELKSIAVGDDPAKPCKKNEKEVHLGNGDITDVNAGTGLQGGADSGAATLAIAPGFRLPQNCTDAQVAKAGGGVWSCANDLDTHYTAGLGLLLTGTEFGLSPLFQLPQTCGSGQVAKWDGAAWACAQDNDTSAGISVQQLAAGNASCPNGGVAISAGGETAYACNGADGAQGPPGTGGSLASPNGQFSIEVTNFGVFIRSPTGSFAVGGGGGGGFTSDRYVGR